MWAIYFPGTQGSLKQRLNSVIKILLYPLKGTRKDVGSVAGLEM